MVHCVFEPMFYHLLFEDMCRSCQELCVTFGKRERLVNWPLTRLPFPTVPCCFSVGCILSPMCPNNAQSFPYHLAVLLNASPRYTATPSTSGSRYPVHFQDNQNYNRHWQDCGDCHLRLISHLIGAVSSTSRANIGASSSV